MAEKKPEGSRVVRSLKDAMIEFNTRNQVQTPPPKTATRETAPKLDERTDP